MVQRGMTKKLHYIIVEIELKSLIYPLQKKTKHKNIFHLLNK